MGQGIIENTPTLETERLVLRRFKPEDAQAFFQIMSDREVNTFLPWFPADSLEAAGEMLRAQYLDTYAAPSGYRYAICLRGEDAPIGYVGLSGGEAHDFGYGLRREYWRRGIVPEAGAAVIERLRRASGLPFITATHDVNNPASGAVMRKLGMTYRYSYQEHWLPKDIQVTFRMYQLDFAEDVETYRGYWERYPEHRVEPGL